MNELPAIIKQIRGEATQPEFAGRLTAIIHQWHGNGKLPQQSVSVPSISRYESGERVPKGPVIAALLRVAEPEQQRALLEALGIEDVTEFATALLESAGVVVVEVKE
jgi:hypothetical protein